MTGTIIYHIYDMSGHISDNQVHLNTTEREFFVNYYTETALKIHRFADVNSPRFHTRLPL